MVKCQSCTKIITKKNQVLECSRCQKVVHATIGCTGLSSKQLTALRVAENLEWTCNECNSNSSRRKSFVPLEEYEEEEDDGRHFLTENDDVEKLLSKMKKEICNILTAEIRSVTTAVQFCSDKVDSFAETLEVWTGRFKELEKKQLHLENKNRHLELKIEAMEQRNNEIEQERIADCVEIAGIPETNDEDLTKLVNKVTEKLLSSKEEIVSAKRIGPRRPGPTTILVKMRNPGNRQMLIKSSRNNTILVRDILPNQAGDTANVKIFVREALTPFNKTLLWQARQDLKDAFKFIWCCEGRILARKTENSKIYKIRSKSDIQSLH